MSDHEWVSSGVENLIAHPTEGIKRVATVGTGLALLAHGIRRRGIIGAVTTAAGAILCVQGFTGKSLPSLLASAVQKKQGKQSSESPEPADDVEEASMDSFPASDAPSSHHSEATDVASSH